MIPGRQIRVRVLEALDREVKQFRTREELYPLRVPREPIALCDVLAPVLGDEHRRFDPITLRSRTVLHLEWADGSAWDLWVVVLPSGLKLFCDSGEEEARILASGGRNLGDETDRLLLDLLAESAGSHFGIELAGDAPTRVRSSIADRPFLLDFFVTLFEGTELEASIRRTWGTAQLTTGTDVPPRRDFQAEVSAWLDAVLD
jgi:hypothetical protein